MFLAQKKFHFLALYLYIDDLRNFEVEADPSSPPVGEFELKIVVIWTCGYQEEVNFYVRYLLVAFVFDTYFQKLLS